MIPGIKPWSPALQADALPSEPQGSPCFIKSGWKWKWSRSVCLTLCDPVDCSPPGSSIHGILQARILEWVAISFSRGSSRPRDRTHVSCVSCIGRQVLYHLQPFKHLDWSYMRYPESEPPSYATPKFLIHRNICRITNAYCFKPLIWEVIRNTTIDS